MPTTPALGYGQRGDAPIDQVNIWMRSTPWYQSLIKSFGQQPNNVHLNDQQKQQVIRAAQANGVVVDEGGNGQEIDDSGNFQAKSHTLRNTLTVAGIAAAAIATMGAAGVFGGAAAAGSGAAGALPAGVTLEGTAAGLGGASTAIGAGTLASTTTVPTVGALAAGGTGLAAGATAPLAAYGLGTSAIGGLAPGLSSGASTAGFGGGSSIYGAGGAAAAGGLSYADLLKYGVPTAGSLIGGLVQASAQGKASDAQQKYLEEALAYQKEQDTYNRNRQAGLDAQEVQRYGNYQGRIGGFIANGQNSNDRMSALLGLPARAPGSSSGASSYGTSTNQGVALSPEITARLAANYKDLGVSPTGAGSGPTDIGYYGGKVAETGGLTDANTSYWFGPNGRIAQDLAKAGVQGSPATPPSMSPAAPPVTTQPQTRAAVQMRAPDGSVKSVPADQVDHFTQLGATVLQGAA